MSSEPVKIPLMSEDKIVYLLVDEEDFPKVSRFKWYLMHGYARAENRRTTVSLARLVMGFPDLEIDHINRDKLDNRKANLRLATRRQNNMNAVHTQPGKYRGVSQRSKNSWRAAISVGTHPAKKYDAGGFGTPEEAALAYNELARKYHGEFAILNDVPTI